MTKNVFRKGLVIGIIILFLGASILPSISGDIGKITTTSNQLRTYIRYDDFDDYNVGESPKAERGWSTDGITENQYIEACIDPLDPDNMVMKIHGSSADPDKYCSLRQMYFGPPGSYVIHYRIYSPDLSMQATIYEDFTEHGTGGVVNIHRRTGQIRWHDGNVFQEFVPHIDPSTTRWIEEEFTITADEVHLFHDDSIDAVGGFRHPVEIGIEIWHIEAFRLATQDFYIDDFWITQYGNQLPTVEITYPVEGQTVSGTITITGNANDPEGNLEYVEVKIDLLGNWETATGTTSWTYEWDTTGLPNGRYTIYARSFDRELYSDNDTVNVYVYNMGDINYNSVLIGVDESLGSDLDVDHIKDALMFGANWFSDSQMEILKKSQCTKSAIRDDALGWLDDNEDSNDVSLIYFSGHGGDDGTNQWMVLFNDEKWWDYEFAEDLERFEGSLIVILDCCHSGGMPDGYGMYHDEWAEKFAQTLAGDNRVILMACRSDETTISHNILGYNGGLFTQYICSGLYGAADNNADDDITAEELFNYAEPMVLDYLDYFTDNDFHPVLLDEYEGELITSMGVLNTAPSKTSTLNAPNYAREWHDYTYSTSATDPDSDKLCYVIVFGKDYMEPFGTLYNSGETYELIWNWYDYEHKTYQCRVIAQDEHGALSPISDAKSIIVNSVGNPPFKPSFDGPTKGTVGETYTYTSCTTDVESDELTYDFNWKDGSNTYIGPIPSGETASASHKWEKEGTYTLYCRVKDDYGAESPWSNPLEVTMPRSKLIPYTFFMRLLERFPNAFPILQRLLLRLGLQY
ncbi:MAG: caspase family protein [Thermoplasmatales archaeon]|nr:caspase family protein [Thermoplasmatales archaeon]